MTAWKPFPPGTRVRHLHDQYEGWIDGLTECLDGSRTNPDGRTQYRVRIYSHKGRKLSSHDELEDCKDTHNIFRSTQELLKNTLEEENKRGEDNDRWATLLPLPYTVWALNDYGPSSQGDPVKLVKDAAIGNTTNAVDQFFGRLDKTLNPGIPIAIVPSSQKGEYNPTLLKLAERLAENGRTDATSLVARHQSIEPSRWKRQNGRPGNTIDEHIASIQIAEPSRVTGKIVLLLDDVVTNGATFMACRKLLLDAGVAEVICLALGRTQRRYQKQDKDHKKTRTYLKINWPK